MSTSIHEFLDRAGHSMRYRTKMLWGAGSAKFGKICFGTSIKPSNYVRGQIRLLTAPRRTGVAIENGGDARDLATHLRKFAYVRLPDPYPADLLEPVRAKYLSMIEDERFSEPRGHDYLFKQGLWFSRSIVDPLVNVPEIAALLTPALLNLLQAYYRAPFRLVSSTMWRNYHAPMEVRHVKNQVYSNNWHCDDQRSDQLTLFINLGPVTEEDGPLHLQPRKRTRQLMRMGYRTRGRYGLPEAALEDTQHVVRHTGPAGSAILCNTCLCLHRADVPGENHIRDIMEFRFQLADGANAADWRENLFAEALRNQSRPDDKAG